MANSLHFLATEKSRSADRPTLRDKYKDYNWPMIGIDVDQPFVDRTIK
jgi:hypothetical protein